MQMRSYKSLLLMGMLLFVPACSSRVAGYAPDPPQSSMMSLYAQRDPITRLSWGTGQNDDAIAAQLNAVQPAAGPSAMQSGHSALPQVDLINQGSASGPSASFSSPSNALPASCSIKDRFDRKALIAYQWRDNRLGLDVDGIGLDGMQVEAVRVGYTLKLQPHKTRKEKCLYASSWQGMVGSGYNEFFVREDNTVQQELRYIKDDVLQRLGSVVD